MTMFKLYALVSIILSGQVPPQPDLRMSHNLSFATAAECELYAASDEGQADEASLTEYLKAQDEALKVEFKCEPKIGD